MSAVAAAEPAAPIEEEVRGGTVAVLLTGERADEDSIGAAVAIAARLHARIVILAIARRVPLSAFFVSWSMTPPGTAFGLRDEAVSDAAEAALRGAALIPPNIPAEHVVVTEAPSRALERLLRDRAVLHHVVVDRKLLARRPGLRRASHRWRQRQVALEVV